MDSSQKHQQFFGIKELYCPESEATVDVIAVHGLEGDAVKTWTCGRSKSCWLSDQDLLPKYLKDARILTYGYNANISSYKGKSTSSDRILQHAHSLVAHLQADRELEGASERPIIFLCHSLGGIIVKRALAYSFSQTSAKTSHLHSIYTCTYGILFFGTPHRGSGRAHLLGSLQKLVSLTLPKKVLETDSNLIRALEEDSEILENITDQFAPLLPRFRIFFFWEQQRTDFKYTKEYVVNETSAAPILDGTERAGIAADHIGMCKFEGRDAPGFRTVVSALRRYCREAPDVVGARRRKAISVLEGQRWDEAVELVGDFAKRNDLAHNPSTSYGAQTTFDSVADEQVGASMFALEQPQSGQNVAENVDQRIRAS